VKYLFLSLALTVTLLTAPENVNAGPKGICQKNYKQPSAEFNSCNVGYAIAYIEAIYKERILSSKEIKELKKEIKELKDANEKINKELKACNKKKKKKVYKKGVLKIQKRKPRSRK
jgi:hypothetical protein